MRYRLPLITYIHGPEDSGKWHLANALESQFRSDLDQVQRINNFSGADELPIEKWRRLDRVIVVSNAAPPAALRKQCYEVIELSARRRPAWLKKLMQRQLAGPIPGNERAVGKYDWQTKEPPA